MSTRFRAAWKAALASVALGALVPLAACNQADRAQSGPAQRLPDLPATMPLALGDERPLTYAPAVQDLPQARRIPAVRVARPDDYYAWADDAWDYYDALSYAPPDYGFYYDDVEPWAWQGYDDSLLFIEPLAYGYRSYFFRPGEEYPYFIRDPDWGYGYDAGRLAVIYDASGAIIPYDRYSDGPWLDYGSRYYDRGYQLYQASIERHPVIAANWYAVQPTLSLASSDWSQDLWQQPQWQAYHQRAFAPRESYWQPERERRQAEAVRYAAWQEGGFESAPPPRAIPRNWKRADWARDTRWFAPPVGGFNGDAREQQRATAREQERVASLVRATSTQDRVRLAALRERVGTQPAIDTNRIERIADLRQHLERRQAQLAARDDRGARQERALVEDQQRRLARAQQDLLRQQAMRHDRRGAAERLAGLEQRQQRQQLREQRFNEVQVQQQMRERLANEARHQADLQARAQIEQRRQAQAEGRQRQQAEANARAAQREQARQGVEQGRAAQEQDRQAARQRFEQQRQARDQARQAMEQQRKAREQARQATQQRFEQQRQARDQARQAMEQQRQAHEQARQAAEQQRAAQQQARESARQAAEQARAQQVHVQHQPQPQVAQENPPQGGGDNGRGHGRGPH